MLPLKRTERIDRATASEPKAPQDGADQAVQNQAVQDPSVQSQTVQVSSVRETINLLESDLGVMIGEVQRACELVCREAEDSAAAIR